MSIKQKFLAVKRKCSEFWKRSNFPELSRYCGCCQLSTGILMQSVLSLISVGILTVYNGIFLSTVLRTRASLRELSAYEINEESNWTITDDDLKFISNILTSITVHYLVWISLKTFYILAIFAALFSVYATRPKLLKAAYCVIIPNWILDIIMLLGAKAFVKPSIQIIFLIDICMEGYYIIAMISIYRQMMKKSRIVPKEDFTVNRLENTASTPSSINPSFSESAMFCASCTNLHSLQIENRSDRVLVNCTALEPPPEAINIDVAVIPVDGDDEKTVNFKDGPIIFNQEQLADQNNSLFVERNDTPVVRPPRAVRPTSLNV